MRNRQAMGMPSRSMKVGKDELLGELRKNLETHIRDHAEATKGYIARALEAVGERQKAILKELAAKRERLELGDPTPLAFRNSLGFDFLPPESHEKDYRQIIRMVEMSVEEHITVSSEEFSCYVMDDWDWKDEFTKVLGLYSTH